MHPWILYGTSSKLPLNNKCYSVSRQSIVNWISLYRDSDYEIARFLRAYGILSFFLLFFFAFLHIYSHCTQAKINSQTKKIGKKIERNTEEKNGEHAIRSNATENLSHSRIILPIFMISVVWPILLWLFTEWKMNTYTRNRDVTMFFYFHFVFFFVCAVFHFGSPFICWIWMGVRATVKCRRVLWRFNNTTDMPYISRWLVEFVSFRCK